MRQRIGSRSPGSDGFGQAGQVDRRQVRGQQAGDDPDRAEQGQRDREAEREPAAQDRPGPLAPGVERLARVPHPMREHVLVGGAHRLAIGSERGRRLSRGDRAQARRARVDQLGQPRQLEPETAGDPADVAPGRVDPAATRCGRSRSDGSPPCLPSASWLSSEPRPERADGLPRPTGDLRGAASSGGNCAPARSIDRSKCQANAPRSV